MASRKLVYGSETAITITLASLAQAACRESTAVDNSSNLFLDAMVRLELQLQTGTPASDLAMYVYAYGSADGTNYDDNATGTDAALTLRSPTNLRRLKVIYTPTSGGLLYKAVIPSIAAAFDGILPAKWGIAVENQTNIALHATEGNHAKTYRGIYESIA